MHVRATHATGIRAVFPTLARVTLAGTGIIARPTVVHKRTLALAMIPVRVTTRVKTSITVQVVMTIAGALWTSATETPVTAMIVAAKRTFAIMTFAAARMRVTDRIAVQA